MEFKYEIRRKPDMVLNQVCSLAQDKLVVSGDQHNGEFSGLFDGFYSVDGAEASITIRRKPVFVSWKMVDQGLRHLVA